jgi:hypothetical protein
LAIPLKTEQQMPIREKATISEGENVSEIQSLTFRARDLSQSVDWWNNKMIWALVFAAIAAVAVVATTYMALKRAKQLTVVQDKLLEAKDGQLTVDLKDKDVKIAEAGSRAAAAETKAEGFRLDIGNAKAAQQKVQIELARQEERAAKAERALLELQERNKPRQISGEQARQIIAKLKEFSGLKVNLFAYAGDEEIVRIANQIILILRAPNGAGWLLFSASGNELGRAVSGILVEIKTDADPQSQAAAVALVSALKGAGLECEGPEIAASIGIAGMTSGPIDPAAVIKITIGKKY